MLTAYRSAPHTSKAQGADLTAHGSLLLHGDAEGLATVLGFHDIHAGVLDDSCCDCMEIFDTASRERAYALTLSIKDVVVLFCGREQLDFARKSGSIFRIDMGTVRDILFRLIFVNPCSSQSS